MAYKLTLAQSGAFCQNPRFAELEGEKIALNNVVLPKAMKSKKRQFIEACKSQPAAWLKACADNPSPHMRPMDVALVRLALRKGWHA